MLKIDHQNLYHSFHYKKFAGKSLDWCSTDSKILYDKNYLENFELLKSNGWIDTKFKYTFNSHGFRSDEFSSSPSIMFLGCSYTMGIGLPIENVWSTIVAKQLNIGYTNLAVGGGANDTAFRLCLGWIDKIKPKMVILLQPPEFRIELVNNYKNRVILVSNYDTNSNFFEEWSITDDNNYLNSLKNTLAIKSLCNDRNIKYYYFNHTQLSVNPIDLARDLGHVGPKTHLRFAEYVLEQIEK
jgi:hypothetical protein